MGKQDLELCLFSPCTVDAPQTSEPRCTLGEQDAISVGPLPGGAPDHLSQGDRPPDEGGGKAAVRQAGSISETCL